MKFTITIMALLFTFSGYSEEAMTTPQGTGSEATKSPEASRSTYTLCKNKSVVRTIRIEKMKNHCLTTYSKDGVETVVGKSGDAELCHEVFEKIKDNLVKANWKCKDITQSRVSSSAE